NLDRVLAELRRGMRGRRGVVAEENRRSYLRHWCAALGDFDEQAACFGVGIAPHFVEREHRLDATVVAFEELAPVVERPPAENCGQLAPDTLALSAGEETGVGQIGPLERATEGRPELGLEGRHRKVAAVLRRIDAVSRHAAVERIAAGLRRLAANRISRPEER